jgi:lysozyme family protein
MSDIFDTAIISILENEGGFSNDPTDRGGRTQYGITQATYDGWNDSKDKRRVDVAKITHEEAIEIYRANYWNAGKFALIESPLIASKLFDLAVNCGVGAASILLQDAVNICSRAQLSLDGSIGPKTAQAANAIDETLLYNMVRFLAAHRYLNLINKSPDQVKFRRGWLLRLSKDNIPKD